MKNIKLSFLLFAALFLFGGLNGCQHQSTEENQKISKNDYLLMPTLWVQSSAEYRALCYQTYDLAQKRLKKNLEAYKGKKKPAVVLDLDETVLDNSPYEAHVIKTGKSYPEDWLKWCDMAKAEAIPGAREFLLFAKQNDVEIYYISNRREKTRKGTVLNLKNLKLPFSDDAHVFLRTDVSSKEPRRQVVRKEHEILLLFGDNLLDFSSLFEQQTTARRAAIVDSLRNEFGTRFIVLPNPMYGDWDSSVLKYDNKQSNEERLKHRRDELKGF